MKFDRSLPMRHMDMQERVAEALLAIQCDTEISKSIRTSLRRQLEELMNDVVSLSEADFAQRYETIRRRVRSIIPELDLVGMYVPSMNGSLPDLRKEFLGRVVVYDGELRTQLGKDPAIVKDVNEKLFVLEGQEMTYGNTHRFSHAAFFRGIRNGTINLVKEW